METMSAHEEVRAKAPAKFERISLYVFLVVVFLLPIFFIPSTSVPFQATKTMLVAIGTLLALLVYIIARLKDGFLTIQKTYLSLGLLALPIVAILSSLFSPNIMVSMFGQGFEVGTAIYIAIATVFALLIPSIVKTRERIFYAYIAFIGSFLLIALFHLGRIAFGPGFLSFGIFTSITQNPIGSWNELGIFFGLTTMLSVITLELLTLSRVFKVLLYVALAISLFLTVVVNFTPVWYVLGIFGIVFFVYLISFFRRHQTDEKRKVSYISLAVLVVALVLILGGGTTDTSLGIKISKYFNVQNIDVRPSLSATLDIAKNTLKTQPVFGSGPNRFVNEWLKFKPAGLNNTVFWNTDFNYGIGLIPTFLVTQGLLGILAWLVFFVLFIWIGLKAILRAITDPLSRYLIISSFLVGVYLWVFTVIYIPSVVLFTLAFIFTGLFIAAMAQEGVITTREIPLFKDPKVGFGSILILVALLVLAIVTGYVFIHKYTADIYYQSSLVEFNQKANLDAAAKDITTAAQISALDIYYQSLSDIDIARMNALVNRKDLAADALKAQFQTVLGSAVANAQEATKIDPTNYQNWVYLGRVYEAVLPLGIPGAYDSAKAAYTKALDLNPQSPALMLTLARLEAVNNKFPEAKQLIYKAVTAKNDYTEAIFLLAQIQVQEGNVKDAISSVESAAFISPNDPGIEFQLGVLRYSNKDYKGAIDALVKAVNINKSYSNARYFLGLSLAQLGDFKDAIDQFTVIKQLNPDNNEVTLILQNLQAGRSPFVNAQPPVDSKPEKRKTLPVKES